MSLTVRSLLAKVKPFRRDVEEDRAIYAIQESVRKICRQTGMAEETVAVPTVAAQAYVLVTPTGGDLFRVNLVRVETPEGWKTIYELNQTEIDNTMAYRDSTAEFPTGWAHKSGSTVMLYPATTGIENLEVTASYIPQGEFDTIPLPDEAEDCIVSGALASILMLPGAGQNLALAKDRELLHNRELGSLRGIAEFGRSGRTRAYGPAFYSRPTRFSRW